MPANAMGMGFVFTATNLAKPTFRGVQKDLTRTAATADAASKRIDASMNAIKAGAFLAIGGLVGVGTSFALAGRAGEFERGIAGVGAITRATTTDLRKLEKAAIDAGIKTQFSPTEAVEGLTSLGQAGLNATESMQALQPTLDLAAGSLGQLGVADAAGLSVQAMKAFGIGAKDVGFALDRMLRTTNSFNISARELPLAFGIGARGALALNASLDDVAISLGMAKNIMPSVERASTSIAVSMERLSRKTGQMKLQTEFGVSAIDKATGKFRPYLDIIIDMIEKSKKMTEAQRSNALAQIFGARAGGGVQAILKQLTDGVKTNTGEILKGRDAVHHYRREMQAAAGAAGEFSSALLNTFAGQKILLQGTLQTLAIVLGKPFARVLKPFVKLVTDTLNTFIRLFEQIPGPAQDVVAAIFLIGSSVMLLTGIVLLAKGAFGLLAVTFAEFITMVKASLLTVAPFVLAVLGVIVALKLFSMAWKSNFGGIREIAEKVISKVKLLWNGLVQAFTQGGFSGAVMKELNRAENKGIKRFVVMVFVWFARLRAFFRELGGALSGLGDVFAPVFAGIVEVLEKLGRAFGFAFSGKNDPKAAAQKYAAFAGAGKTLGDIIVVVADAFVGPLAVALSLVAGLMDMVATGVKGLQVLLNLLKIGVIRWATAIRSEFDRLSKFLKTAFVAGIAKAAALVAKHAGTIIGYVNKAISATSRIMAAVGITTPTGEPAAGGTAGPASPMERAARALGPGATAAETRMATMRFQAAQEAGWTDAQMEKLARTIAAQQRPVIVEMDGEQVGEITAQARRRATARGFAEVPTGG